MTELLTAEILNGAPPKNGFLDGYGPSAGVHDEMLAPDGSVRPHYRQMIAALARMSEAERTRRSASAAQYLREAGVYYRVYGGPEKSEQTRSWPLGEPPLIIARDEWERLVAGLTQRAGFLEKLIADFYGDRRLLTDGVLPAAILGRNPEFLRPLADQAKSGQPLLRFIAVDLGRGPDGRWWVLGDRTQAPSGAGFALENRVATARAFPDLIRDMKVQRLAGFFRRFRESLNAMIDPKDRGRIGLLTPGPANETYFEHAYLARYLGFLLLEGGDLSVQGAKVVVRTVDGAMPINVLWRRLDSDFADPLELHSGSRIGTPGLVRAVRRGALQMVNALGSGILETRALLAFQPALARALIGEDLILPTVATWWCGQENERAYVSANRDRLSLSRAFPQGADTDDRRRPLDLGIRRDPSDRLLDELDGHGMGIVGQEIVGLSTAPVFVDGRLSARPVTMRVYLARDAEGWHVMPGGFARTSSSADPLAVSMQAGGFSVDVWAPSDKHEREVSLLSSSKAFSRRLPSAPPARAADNLYWLGRYVERAEAATRLVRLYAARVAEGERRDDLEGRVAELLTDFDVDVLEGDPAEGLLALARRAFWTASRIRDRFSPDGWRALREVVDLIEAHLKLEGPGDLVDLTSAALTRFAGFAGLVQENMYQFTGWRFLQIGRLLERGQISAGVAAALTGEKPPEGGLEALLEFSDSRITYRRRYTVDLSRETVLDLVVLDPLNPRAIAFQVNGFKTLLDELPGMRRGETLHPVSRRAARLQVRLATGDAAEATGPFLTRIATDLGDISNLLNQRYFGNAAQINTDPLDAE
ncbi:circularly permuted type 2 ATP-grasp protein [Methylopila sp. M107]|uniref:circularly permuted type 2 ATP-grasp protein n=1 Tax=Methylopila sp. M107 TaxID=1101190 RepID=UPI000368CE13|nr:circularly permuted type 2 ATP-grasp protein [Methylopila sp. M107]